jgi:hypothetical protein
MAGLKNEALPAFLAESAICRYNAAKRFFHFFGKKDTLLTCKIGSCSRLYLAIKPRLFGDTCLTRGFVPREKW